MSPFTLVATSLSSIFSSSSQVSTHVIPTTRRDIPLPTNQSSLVSGHASLSTLFNSPQTGQILIRVVQGGLAVELVSLSTNAAPVRFVFPAAVVPSPALVICRSELHLLAVTAVGSLFRLVLPVYEGGHLWHDPFERDWCREWQIKRLTTSEPKLVHVLDCNLISVGLSTGGYVRLESDDASTHEQWSEMEYKLNSWYSTLLPVLPGLSSQPSEIVCLASIPLPTDVLDVFSLSRDRVLRRWTAARGCRTELSLSTGGLFSGSSDKRVALLDAGPQKLLQVFTDKQEVGKPGRTFDQHFLLVFLPAPSSATTGGYFQLFQVDNDRWDAIAEFPSSENSAQCKMQDFMYDCGNLYVLWEKQGESFLEATQLIRDSNECVWSPASYGRPSQGSDKSLEELLLTPGSLSYKFLSVILCPGVFSGLTLREALHDYKKHYLSLPGPHQHALLAPHATLAEDIAASVGCSVQLTHDPQTGVALHRQYTNALRRDWEGFLARCKEIERSARWPISLGLGTEKGQILVFERERIGQCVEEDKPMDIYRALTQSPDSDFGADIIATSWILRQKLPIQLTRKIEAETLNIVASEISFPLADIVIEAGNRVFAREDIDEELDAWVQLQLSGVEGFDQTVRLALDVLTGLDKAVKQEEDEVELIIPPETTEWSKALIASYVADSIDMRYELCLALAVLLFFVGENLRTSDPALLAEVFAVFRGAAMFRLVTRQTAGDLDGSRPNMHDPDDVVARMHGLQMSQGGRIPSPTYSLVHQLVSQSGHPSLVPAAAHSFIEQLGLLTLESPSLVTKAEVVLCERLRLFGYREISRHLLSWLPRTPAVCYVAARLLVDVGRGDDAVLMLQAVAGNFGPDSTLSNDDHETLSAVLPSGSLFPSEFDFYLHVADIYRNAGLQDQEVSFTKLALSVLPDGEDSTDLWGCIIKGYTDLGMYDLAYSSLLACPHKEAKQQHHISSLVYKMCEDEALEQLLSMNFQGFEEEVERSLSFKARNADPRSVPNYAHILYTWYSNRGDLRNAALVMYLRARKLMELRANTAGLDEGEQQLEALLVTMNSLRLLDQKNAWILVPSPSGSQAQKKRRVDSYIPDDKFTGGSRDVEILSVNDIEQEYALLNATLELLRRDPGALRSGDGLPSPWVLVSKLTNCGQYDLAMQTAKALSTDMSEIFQRLSVQCLRLSAANESESTEIRNVDWLLTDKVSSWAGEPSDRGWRYLRQCLGQFDSVDTDFKYSKEVFETLLSHDQSALPPPWLMQRIEGHHPEFLIRCFLKYGVIDEALGRTLQLVRKSNTSWSRTTTEAQSRTWLPYSLVDAVLKGSEGNESKNVQDVRKILETEVTQRIARAKRQSEKAP